MGRDREEMSRVGEIITFTSRLAHAGQWAELDEYVRSFDYAHEDPLFIIAVLRSCYSMREKLLYYQDAVARARNFCSDRELKGLY